jgi:hypothetical protein
MDNSIWRFVKPLHDEHSISEMEEMIGAKFPEDYVACVKQYNRAYPSIKVFRTAGGIERVFSNLLGFNKDDGASIFVTYDLFLTYHEKHKEWLPFAEDPFGNYICFDMSTDPWAVVFWDHETDAVDGVADSFTEFLGMLYPGEDDD